MYNFRNIFVTKNSIGKISRITSDIFSSGVNIKSSQMICNNNILIYKINSNKEIKNSILEKYNKNLFDLLEDNNTIINNTKIKKLSIDCSDSPGIIHETSNILEKMNININKLESSTYPAPISSIEIFNLKLDMNVPNEITNDEIKQKMKDIIERYNIEICID